MPHAGLHTLRHSAASVMLTRGVPLEVVCEILGHSSIAITGRSPSPVDRPRGP
ncbi:tyrosine-type recombinase/integrase [Geodermatophilus sabuli]|uniref:tyrosine-type recombinase/integrase n=1 Tax=Geodermatophilus sabuli TaxID=1564158 RepID=UPI000BE3EA87